MMSYCHCLSDRHCPRCFFTEGRSVDYSEVTSAFSKLVETHFLQRCPPVAGQGKTANGAPEAPATPAAPPTPESFSDCYKVPNVTLIGRGKRQLTPEDGEEQRNAKKARMEPGVGVNINLSVPHVESSPDQRVQAKQCQFTLRRRVGPHINRCFHGNGCGVTSVSMFVVVYVTHASATPLQLSGLKS